MASEASLVFNIIGRDRVGSALARVKAEASAANDEQLKGLKAVESALEKAKLETEKLGQAFKDTGDVDVYRAWKDSERAVAGLEKVHAALKKLKDEDTQSTNKPGFLSRIIDGAGSAISGALARLPQLATGEGSLAGELAGKGFLGSLGTVIMAGGPVLIPAIALLATEAGAMLSGALIGAAGLGGIATGIIAQIHDTRVQSAFAQLVDGWKNELDGMTSSFAPALVQGLNDLRNRAQPFFDAIATPLHNLAPIVTDLLDRLGQGLAKMGPGLAQALDAAGPILERISADIPMLLGSLGDMFAILSEHAKGAGEAIDLLFHLASQAITFIGISLSGLSSVFNAVLQGADAVTGFMAKIPGLGKEWEGVHQYVDNLAHSMDGLGASEMSAAGTTDGLTGGIRGLAGSTTGAVQDIQILAGATLDFSNAAGNTKLASLSFADAVEALRVKVKGNKDAFNENTTAGRQNIDTYHIAEQAARQHAQSVLESTHSAEKAAQAYHDDIGQLDGMLSKAGATTKQIDTLNAELDAAVKYRKGSVDIEVNIAQHGTAVLTSQGVTTFVGSRVKAQRYGGVRMARDGLVNLDGMAGYFAAGGLPTYGFAEAGTGGEAFIARNAPSGPSLAYADMAARWHGGMVVPAGSGGSRSINVAVTVNAGLGTNGAAVGAAIVSEIRKYEKGNGTGWRS